MFFFTRESFHEHTWTKGAFISFLVDVPVDFWWLDSSFTTHIAASLLGFKNMREPSLRESKLKVGNDLEVIVESVGDVSLVLGSGFELVLKDTFYT